MRSLTSGINRTQDGRPWKNTENSEKKWQDAKMSSGTYFQNRPN